MSKSRNRIRFSHRAIDALPVPPKDHPASNVEYSDEVESGLRIAVYKSGRKSFRHRYTFLGNKCSATIGEYPAINVDLARERVREHKRLLAQNIDPREERNQIRQAISFGDFVNQHYLPFAQREKRSYKDIVNRCQLRLIPTFGKKVLERITKADISGFHQRLREEVSATTANRHLSQISAVYVLAIEMGHATSNPARGIKKFREKGPRTRALDEKELQLFITELRKEVDLGNPSAQAIYLLLLSGLRKMEFLSARWEHVDLQGESVFLPNTKPGTSRYLYLNSSAAQLLETMHAKRVDGNPFVFPSRRSRAGHLKEVRRTFATIAQRAEISNLRLHDMRRSFATLLVNNGVDLYVVKDLLGHADVRTTQTTYAHLHNSTLRKATQVVADKIGNFFD
ncbi:tyrosine-type recombinase/integrase [Geoalkalibacter halelectricus]|uniref:Site-specific integrase n=1 Tax=Geoalkalibacter halelectricus TaxID=2847045 RepID=A0ABY5ZIJ1_9BACT|nr:site-specific integrase [Geoalkalibacter halelectricus]MDO3378104.1 site-specific integrase [Geoalkalibacter halelectricus]UWZ78398.1 site-specific integrase [Geoalkalibacter halelectricus]